MKENEEAISRLHRYRESKAASSLITDRNLLMYRRILGLDFNRMKGKLVLDIGSGMNEVFSKEAAKMGIKVVSLNPDLKRIVDKREYKKNWQGLSVAGLAQSMPFDDNVFDFEIGVISVPYYLSFSEEEYRDLFSEVIRTLKPGGEVHLSSILSTQDLHPEDVVKDMLEKALAPFKNVVKYEIEETIFEDEETSKLVLRKNL